MKDFKRIKHLYDKKTLAEREQQVQKPFQGNIPAFKRLAIIYDKNKEYEKAIDICNKAIAYYEKYDMSAAEFYQRRSKIEKKMS